LNESENEQEGEEGVKGAKKEVDGGDGELSPKSLKKRVE